MRITTLAIKDTCATVAHDTPSHVHSRGPAIWCQAAAWSGVSRGFPARASCQEIRSWWCPRDPPRFRCAIGHADVAFTMKQYVQTDLDADREVAKTLADLIIGGLLVTEINDDEADEDNRETA